MNSSPFITIVVPVLNERVYIEKTLDELATSAEAFEYEMIVADGGSTDGTQAIVLEYAQSNPFVRLINNPRRIQSAAVNLAAAEADSRSEILIRADAHCAYPEHFVGNIIEAMVERDAQSVVVPMFTIGEAGTYQESVAHAQNSKMGNGGSAHRDGSTSSGWVEHGHHAAFRRDFFLSIGGYDESFRTNEDAEYDVRVGNSDGRIWMARNAEINYFPRTTPRSLARQYFGYGSGRAQTILKHKIRPRARQLAPFAVFWAVVISVMLSTVNSIFILPAIGYFALCAGYAMKISASESPTRAASSSCTGIISALVIMHLSWGAGFTAGLIRNLADRVVGRKTA